MNARENFHDPTDEDQRLDDLLQAWGQNKEADPSNLTQLKENVLEKLAMEEKSPRRGLHDRTSVRSVVLTWSTAAVLLISAILMTGKLSPPESEDALIRLAETDVNAQKQLLKNFSEVFGEDICSVFEVDGNVGVHLCSESVPAEPLQFTSIRWVLVSRSTASASQEWKILRNVNMLVRTEELVEIPIGNKIAALSVWCYPVSPSLLAVDLNCRIDEPVEIELSISSLQDSGKPRRVFSLIEQDVEYRVYQTVMQLGVPVDVEVDLVKRDPRLAWSRF